MDHDAVAALLGDPTAVISDADWLAIEQHFAVCDLCIAGPAVLAAAVQGELSLIRFGLDAGRSIFRPWWLGGPIIGLVITAGILSYLFFSGGPAQPVPLTSTPTPSPTASATATPTPTPTPTPAVTPTHTPSPTPSPTPIPTIPTVLPSPRPTPSPQPTTTPETPTPVPTPMPTPTLTTTPSLCPATCVPTEVPLMGTATEDAAYAQELFRLTNELRVQAGLDPLVGDARLLSSAREYARFVVLSRWWTAHPYAPEIHCGEDCRDMYDRVLDAGYPPAKVGEIVMWGSVGRAAEQAFNEMIAATRSLPEDPMNPRFGRMAIACHVRSDPAPAEYACVQILAAAP